MKARYLSIAGAAFLFLSLLVAASFATWNACRGTRWHGRPAAPGRVFSLTDGTRLYARVRGSGSPAIVVVAGLGSTVPEWLEVQERLRARAQVMVYDRPGYGWSGEARSPRSADAAARELAGLLEKARVLPPYILVGSGIGAVYALRYAQTLPRCVAGMVLVDPVGPGYERYRRELDPAVYVNLIDRGPALKVARVLAACGVIRAFGAIPYRLAPAAARSDIVEHFSRGEAYDAMLAEYAGLGGDLALINSGPSLRVPVRILRGGHSAHRGYLRELLSYGLSYDEAEEIIGIGDDMVARLRRIAPRSSVIVTDAAGEELHLACPAAVVREVESLLHLIR